MRPGIKIQLLLGVTGLCISTALNAASIHGVRTWSDAAKTRVVLDLDGPADHRLFVLDDPQRIVIDLPGTQISPQFSAGDANGLVRRIRTGERPDNTSRVVLDIQGSARSQSFALPPGDGHGHRVVVDLQRASGPRAEIRAPGANDPRGRDLVIAIDAGHGGKDPGASGSRGVREKDIVMQIARRLETELKTYPGFRPVLVRSNDTFLSLRERTTRAREAEADLFVSIHADAYSDSRARGATVYVLSEKGASDEAGRRLAQRENEADLVGGVSLAEQDSDIASVILDITQSAAISASMSAADNIIDELGSVTRMRKTDVQHAGFVVLKSPDIPSLLIETAYLSNPKEEAELRSAGHQTKLAEALASGIARYFFENPPPGSYLAMHPEVVPSELTRHNVSHGETLSQIAQRYRISVDRLINSNQLKNDRIRTGQVLTIPRG